MIGIIPAAGSGTRAYPYTQGLPKGMIDVAGQPNIERLVAIMRDQLRVTRIVVVVGTLGHYIRDYLGDGSRHGVPISYVQNDAVERGLGYSLLLARPFVDDYCCVMLSDECYVDSNHADLLATDYRDCVAMCAVQTTDAPEVIARNYAVYATEGRVRRVIEKPTDTRGALLGLGTLLLSREFFEYLGDAVAAGDAQDPSDPISVLDRLCLAGAHVGCVELVGLYVNINDRDALNLARITVRSQSFAASTVGLALLMKGNADDTARALREFGALGRFTQIVLVAPPNAATPTMPDGVGLVRASSSLYGDMMRCGFEALTTDIIVCAHSDGSCKPRDVSKLLEYLKEADLVVGTRTTRQLVEQGSNMRGIVRLAHVILAKILEAVWWDYEPRFTDLGCTYRAAWRSTYLLIHNRLRASGPEYSVEMLLEVIKCRRRVIEIPVSFGSRRRGVKEPDQTLYTFYSMLSLIVRRRFAQVRPRVRAAQSR